MRTGDATGGVSGARRASVWPPNPDAGASPLAPPLAGATLKAWAGDRPAQRDAPLRRSSTADRARVLAAHADAPPLSRSTIGRILDRAALKPWRQRQRRWLFPRAPQCAAKAGRVLDLYAGVWDDHPLHPDDGILRAEEKTSIQARRRCPPSRPPRPGPPLQGEHEYEYEREGALAYLAAWDGRRGRIQGRWEATSGKAPFGRLGDQVRPPEPSRSAPRVFWSVARGSRHRGAKSARALAARQPTLILVHGPTHASWLNPIALYVSLIQRKVRPPTTVADLAAVAERLLAQEGLYKRTAHPFAGTFTRAALEHRLAQLARTQAA